MDEEIGTGAERPTPEQAAELAALAQAIAESEPPDNVLSIPDEQPPEVVNSGTDKENLAGIIELLFLPAPEFGFKRVADIWTPDVCRRVADRAVPVLQKSGWGRAFLAWCREGFGIEEMALAAVLFPLIKKTRDAVIADLEDKAAALVKDAD